MVNKTECVVCTEEVEVLEVFNGEIMCEECYNAPENEVFLIMTIVYFDPGHGLKEKDLVLKIAKYARTYLQNNYKNVTVKMSRTTDKFLSLTQRANDAKSWGAGVFISFHTNAHTASAKGYEDFVFNGSTNSKTASLQNAVHKEVSPLFDINRGKKKANFAVLRQTKMPAVLTESGFITHKSDADYLSKDNNLKKIGEADAKSIAVFLGLAKGSINTYRLAKWYLK